MENKGFKRSVLALGAWCIAVTAVHSLADDTDTKGADGAPASPSKPFTASNGSLGGIPVGERQISQGPHGEAIVLGSDAHPFTLPQLLDEALRRNPATRQTWELTRAAVANVGVARSSYYPTITVGGSVGPTYSTATAEAGGGRTDGFSYGPQVQIEYLLFDFGARAAGVEAARFQLLASDYNQNTTLQNVILQVEKAYYALDGAKAQVATSDAALKFADASAESARRRAGAGLGTRTAVLQAEQSAAQSRYNLENARGQLAVAQVALASSLGLPANAEVHAAPPAHLPTAAEISDSVDVLIDRALRQRPDIASKFAVYKQDAATARQADADIYPQVTVGASGQRAYYNDKTTGNDFGANGRFSGSSDNASAQLTISVDLFDGFYKVNQARIARREADAAKADLANSELAAIADVVSNFVTFKSYLEQYKAAEALVESSRKSYEATSISYKAGLVTILDLLTAQSGLASGEATLAQSRTALFTASAQLSNATGALLPQGLDASKIAQATQAVSTVKPAADKTP